MHSTVSRYALPDTLRGMATISMVLYHGVWDMDYLAGLDWAWYQGPWGYLWQQSTCWTFFLLAGFCWPFSRNPIKKALVLLAAGGIVTTLTLLVMPAQRVVFGVLTQLGFCTLALAVMRPLLEKVRPAMGLLGSAVLFFLTRDINTGFLGFEGLRLIALPAELYRNLFTTFFGFQAPGFYSADYFSVFPWAFLFLCGFFLAKTFPLRHGGIADINIPFFSLVGRHSLPFYLAHQPVLYLALVIWQNVFG